LIINTGQVPLAYTAEPQRQISGGGGYSPGVQFGDAHELSGVLNPGRADRLDTLTAAEHRAILSARLRQ
jgi:hypothetical protein